MSGRLWKGVVKYDQPPTPSSVSVGFASVEPTKTQKYFFKRTVSGVTLVAHACNPNTWEVAGRGSGAKGHCQLYIKLNLILNLNTN